MSVQYYRKFSKYRARKNPNIDVLAEFVMPCTLSVTDDIVFMIKTIDICRRKKDNHFVIFDTRYKLDCATRRFNKYISSATDNLHTISTQYGWLLDQKFTAKLIRAGLLISLCKAVDKDKLLKIMQEIKACITASLL